MKPHAILTASLLTAALAASATPHTAHADIDLRFVAHPDDDLLFMNPDIATSIARGHHAITVFITAGISGDAARLTQRELGILNAYAYMAGPQYAVTDVGDASLMLAHWSLNGGGPTTIGARQVIRYDLNEAAVSVVFVRAFEENGNTDLRTLWEGTSTILPTTGCSDGCLLGSSLAEQTYDRELLIETLAGIMEYFHQTQPENALEVSTLDSTGLYHIEENYGLGWMDHADHLAAAKFATTAFHRYHARASTAPRSLRHYRGYNTGSEPINLGDDDQILAKRRMFYRYYALGEPMSQTDPATGIETRLTNDNPEDPEWTVATTYNEWTQRKYAVLTYASKTNLRGRLMTAQNLCLRLVSGSLRTGSCTGAPEWELTTRNEIRLGTNSAQCVVLGRDNLARLETCLGTSASEAQTLVLMSNGQVRARNATCLRGDSTRVRSEDCDALHDTRSNPLRRPIVTQDWTLIFSEPRLISLQFGDSSEVDDHRSYYRTVTLADGNICLRRSGGVGCARYNETTGTLDPFTYWSTSNAEYTDALGWRDDSTGGTVMFGHLNSFSRPLNVCGRGYYGIRCGIGASATWWTTEFSTPNGWASSPSYYGSVRLTDVDNDGNADVCGRGYHGIWCALGTGTSFGSPVLMTFEYSNAASWNPSQYGETIQYGDLDGDGRKDICGRGVYGMLCGISAPYGIGFIETHTWAFNTSNNQDTNARDFGDSDPAGAWANNAAKYRSTRLVDINRDGMADICGRGTNGIVCALSTGTALESKRNVMPFLFTDNQAWNWEQYGSTLTFGRLDSDARVDLCARGIDGIWCSEGP